MPDLKNCWRPEFTAQGRFLFRNGLPIAETTNDDLARALAIALDGAQLLFGPNIPIADQDFAAITLWPAEPRSDALDPLLSAEWED